MGNGRLAGHPLGIVFSSWNASHLPSVVIGAPSSVSLCVLSRGQAGVAEVNPNYRWFLFLYHRGKIQKQVQKLHLELS